MISANHNLYRPPCAGCLAAVGGEIAGLIHVVELKLGSLLGTTCQRFMHWSLEFNDSDTRIHSKASSWMQRYEVIYTFASG
jgi:hypothetical protein